MTNNIIHLTLDTLITANAQRGALSKQRNSQHLTEILGHREDSDVIDLKKSLQNITPLLHIITETIANHETILVVAQKTNIHAEQFPQPIITDKWLHGALSNFKTTKHSKKNPLKQIPAAIILLNTATPELLLNEAKFLEIPTIALQQTNENPSIAQYAILANKNDKKTIELFVDLCAQAAFFGYAKRILSFKKTNYR